MSSKPVDLSTFRAPPRTGTVGLMWMLAGIVFLFAWLTYGYLIIRGRSDLAFISLPLWFWPSTLALLVASVMLHGSYLFAKGRRLDLSRRTAFMSLALGGLFIVLQVPGLIELIQAHRPGLDDNAMLYRLVVLMIALHGLHVLVGMGLLLHLNRRLRQHLAHHPRTIRHLLNVGLYWHTMALIWLVMFGAMLIARGTMPLYDI